MTYAIITTTLNLPYVTPNPFKGTLRFPLKDLYNSPGSNGLRELWNFPEDLARLAWAFASLDLAPPELTRPWAMGATVKAVGSR